MSVFTQRKRFIGGVSQIATFKACLLLLTGTLPLWTFAQNVREAWVARFALRATDQAFALAVDSWGNVHVTGLSTSIGVGLGYLTVKYDTNGNRLWGVGYDPLPNSEHGATAIAVDRAGNVYVTGYEWNSINRDYATIKYDANGRQLWVARYNGPGRNWDVARAIAVDEAGNVYVTGYSGGIGTRSDYLTIKYDTNGNQLWVARYDGPANLDDVPYAIAVDSVGSVYVTGYSVGNGTNHDYATVKYDANGNQLWVARYHNGPLTRRDDRAYALAVDSAGSVYVTGFSDTANNPLEYNYDYVTIKYDTNGNQLWVARYNGPSNRNDVACAVAVDRVGNVYVTGSSESTTPLEDYVTVKYDANGNQLWVARYNGSGDSADTPIGIAVDHAGNAYITGSSIGIGTDYDYATVKYDANGSQRWVMRYNGSDNRQDFARAIALDSAGSVYVTGYSVSSTTGSDYVTIKYVQSPAGDVNGSGCVDDSDLLAVLFAFGNTWTNLPEDLNRDGIVDDADLLIVLFDFGSGC